MKLAKQKFRKKNTGIPVKNQNNCERFERKQHRIENKSTFYQKQTQKSTFYES